MNNRAKVLPRYRRSANRRVAQHLQQRRAQASRIAVRLQSSRGNNDENNGNGDRWSGATKPAAPYEGEKHTPPENAKVLETQTGIARNNTIITVYYVETDGGKYYFDEVIGKYYRTAEDAYYFRNSVRLFEVFPNDGWLSDWTSGITVW